MRRTHKYADGGKVVKSETDMDGYDSADNAANAALYSIGKLAKNREHVALIYQDPATGRFLFTDPQSQTGPRGKHETKGAFKVPKGSIRGIIHNHPVDRSNNAPLANLSSPDMDMARQLGVPSYISAPDGLHKWDPKTDKVRGSGARAQGLTTPTLAEVPMDMLPKRRG